MRHVQPISAYNMAAAGAAADIAYGVMATSPVTDLPDLNTGSYELAYVLSLLFSSCFNSVIITVCCSLTVTLMRYF